MNECSPFAAVFGCFLPCVALVEKGEVVLILFACVFMCVCVCVYVCPSVCLWVCLCVLCVSACVSSLRVGFM